MTKDLIIEKTKAFVKDRLHAEGSGHDWFHILRVYNIAVYINNIEKGDSFIVEMTALLHDVEDWKLINKSGNNENRIVTSWLIEQNLDDEIINRITSIINTMSYKGGVVDSSQNTLEGMIVQDADRLDAIGAIGIARTFSYGGNKNRLIYDPSIPPFGYFNLDEFKNKENHTINHFYEKLLKLKDLMNTNTAKKIAIKRHKFMELYLEEFFDEWNSINLE